MFLPCLYSSYSSIMYHNHESAAVKKFHILETRPIKVRWCMLARERGTSTASPLVLRVATLGGCHNPARWLQSLHLCLVEYHKRRDVPAVFQLVKGTRRLVLGRGVWGVCSIHQSQGSTLDAVPSVSLLVCEAAHDITTLLETRASLDCRGSCLPFAGQIPSKRPFGTGSTTWSLHPELALPLEWRGCVPGSKSGGPGFDPGPGKKS
ncbi:hypothetical protein GWK47_042830 [Chionoecetes opilio]|uniref:Uncharacterized protein n=1 Tax=Chionoecetes opilio TaxID=41210 RepID=A0A8J4Y8S7_CHIOP|nr:hypothetical protein GWK47_042830 [Chionoecetes opilio]